MSVDAGAAGFAEEAAAMFVCLLQEVAIECYRRTMAMSRVVQSDIEVALLRW